MKEINQKGFAAVAVIVLFIILAGIAGLVYFGKLSLNNLNPLKNQTKQVVITGDAKVVVTKDGFIPASLSVKKGTQVEWINQDTSAHQLMSDPHPTHDLLPGLNSEEVLNTNDSFAFTFENPGIYTYHVEESPLKNKGTVIVE